MAIGVQTGFFDIYERTSRLTEMGDPLVALNFGERLFGDHYTRAQVAIKNFLGQPEKPGMNPVIRTGPKIPMVPVNLDSENLF